jgi:translation elongation factor P/translation initiation factor 5A
MKIVLIIFHLQTTFEESRLNESDVGDKQKWLKEGMDCILLYWDGRVFSICFRILCCHLSDQLL